MNIADNAQDVEVRAWEARNQPREVKSYSPTDSGYGPAQCEDCGAEMHPVRRSYGYTLCIHCATAAEKLTARRR